MQIPKNQFKEAISQGRSQLGVWHSIRDPGVSEMLAGCGFDWIVLDCEHTAREVPEVLHGLQAMSAYPVQPVVRVRSLDVAEIKKVLDVGAQTILVPYVQNAAEARLAASAVEYPPTGVRGLAGTLRANRFGAIKDYPQRAREEICLIVQIETQEALDDLEEIAGTDGIDGVFIGPADLSASLGYPGQLGHPLVREAIVDAIGRIRSVGKPAGFLSPDPELLKLAMDAGCVFSAIDVDMLALRRVLLERLSGLRS